LIGRPVVNAFILAVLIKIFGKGTARKPFCYNGEQGNPDEADQDGRLPGRGMTSDG
jgi:hypothetical protein